MISLLAQEGIDMNKRKDLFVATILLVVFFLPACLSLPKIQRGMDKLNDTWKKTNTDLLKTAGTREYKITKKVGLNAMVMAATELGFIVDQMEYETGFITAKAPIPTPLTKEEWANLKKIEEPAMKAIVTNEVGSWTANVFILRDEGFDVILNVHMLERRDDLQINLRFALDYTGPPRPIAGGQQPPPESVRLALAKVWDAFERSLLIQKSTFK